MCHCKLKLNSITPLPPFYLGSRCWDIQNVSEFGEQQIIDRTRKILDKFFDFLHGAELIA